jgi:TusA-related sulfurtransferase
MARFGGDLVTVKVDKKLDCLGLYCPEPVFRTRLALDEMEIGETLEVVSDDPAAESDINSLVKYLEQEIVSSAKEGSTIRILIKKIK